MTTPIRFKRRKTSCLQLNKAQTPFQLILLSLNAFCTRQRGRTGRILIRSPLSGTALALLSEIASPSSLTFLANTQTLSRLSNSLLLAPTSPPLATALPSLKATPWTLLLAPFALMPSTLALQALRHHAVPVQSPQHAVNNIGLKVVVFAVVPMTTGSVHAPCHHIPRVKAKSTPQMMTLMEALYQHLLGITAFSVREKRGMRMALSCLFTLFSTCI